MKEIQDQSGKYKRDILVNKIIDLILTHKRSESTILRMLMDVNGEFKYAQSYAYELIREARKYTADVYRDWAIGLIENRVAELTEDIESIHNDKKLKPSERYRLILDNRKELNKIQGLYVERHDISITEYQPLFPIEPIKVIDITPKEIEGDQEDKGIL